MKPPAILLGLVLAATPAFADKADDYYRLGLAAIQQNNPEKAEAAFRQALKLRPDHAYARAQLGNLPGRVESMKAKRRESQLASIRLETVNFDNLTLQEGIDALSQMIRAAAAKSDGGEKAESPNFVVKDPKGELSAKRITLQLKNIPAKAVLDYMVEQAGAMARYDEHAIIVEPAR